LSLSFFCANAPSEATPSIVNNRRFRISLFIPYLCLLMQYPCAHGREKVMRRPLSQQDQCHRGWALSPQISDEESLPRSRNRTVSNWLAPYGAEFDHQSLLRISQITNDLLRSRANLPTRYRRTVTLRVPTFPLVSKARSEMLCSPIVSALNSAI
jgi:hypothetical protein